MTRSALISAFAISLATGCSQSNSAPPKSQAAPAAATVETVAVVSQRLNTTVSLPAQLLPYETVDVYPRVT